MKNTLTKLRRYVRQAGQGMTEYIIIVAVVALGAIAVYTAFGQTLRHQVAAASYKLAGKDTEAKGEMTAAGTSAGEAKTAADAKKSLSDY